MLRPIFRRPLVCDMVLSIFDAFENPLCAIHVYETLLRVVVGGETPETELVYSAKRPTCLLHCQSTGLIHYEGSGLVPSLAACSFRGQQTSAVLTYIQTHRNRVVK